MATSKTSSKTTTKASAPTRTASVSKAAATSAIQSSKLSPSIKAEAIKGLSSYSFSDSGSSNTGPTSTDAAKTSTAYRSDIKNIDRDITGLKNAYAVDDANLRAYQDTLAKRRVDEIAGIKSEFDIAKTAQEIGQGKDYESRATSLITSGGGFLGATQSQQGVLQNLKGTFEAERTALMSKREAAILAAQNAYDEKDFAAARELSKNARELQKEIYSRQKDYADQSLAIARENRAQTEFDMGITEKKINSYAMMNDDDFAKQNPSDIASLDKMYYPGYTANARMIAKKALDVKTKKDAVDLDKDILTARLQMPAGQKFSLGGQTYTGLKDSSGSGGGTESERNAIIRSKVQTLFSPGYTVPGKGIPFIDLNGLPTVDGWKEAMKVSNMDRKEFITQFGYLLQPAVEVGIIDRFGLTRPEKELIEGKL